MPEINSYISVVFELSETGCRLLSSAMSPMHLKAGQHLLREGDVCDSVFFIEEGSCRAYYINDGLELNINFFFECDFVANLKSLTSNSPSEYYIEAYEDTRLVKLNRNALRQAYSASHEIETFGRKVLELITSRLEEHANLFKIMTAEQRYLHLQEHQPELLQRVSLSQIASYIGVSRETLSRIRKRISKK